MMPTLKCSILDKILKGIRSCQLRSSNADYTASPETVVRSIPERWLDSSVRRHIAGMQIIRHAGTETFSYPSVLPPAFRTEMHFALRHVYHLIDVSVNSKSGACASPPLYFQESYGSLRRCLIDQPFPSTNGRTIEIKGFITCVHSAGYYHFLLEEIPRLLWTIEYCKNITVMVHSSAPNYVLDALDIMKRLGIIRTDILFVDDEDVHISDYIFTQAEAYSGFVHSLDIQLLRRNLLNASIEDTSARKYIYISRKNSVRSFCNEDEIIKFIESLGYYVCNLEKMSLESQICLFEAARVVVAPHGAGLANILWCHPGTHILELFSPSYFNDCYARLCSQLELVYKPLWADDAEPWGRVSLEELSENLKQV
jgi:hypothetical protein